MKKILLMVLLMLSVTTVYAADIQLKTPETSGGMPLMDAIKNRRAERAIDAQMLSEQDLSNLLWVTWGFSSDDGKRVVPTARNLQDMELYVLLVSGVYVYDAQQNLLKQLSNNDLRGLVGKEQDYAALAPVHLLFVTKDKKFGAMHAGSMYQNAGLYCSANNLACVVRGAYDRAEINNALNLDQDKEVVITMAVGYKKK